MTDERAAPEDMNLVPGDLAWEMGYRAGFKAAQQDQYGRGKGHAGQSGDYGDDVSYPTSAGKGFGGQSGDYSIE